MNVPGFNGKLEGRKNFDGLTAGGGSGGVSIAEDDSGVDQLLSDDVNETSICSGDLISCSRISNSGFSKLKCRHSLPLLDGVCASTLRGLRLSAIREKLNFFFASGFGETLGGATSVEFVKCCC